MKQITTKWKLITLGLMVLGFVWMTIDFIREFLLCTAYWCFN